MIEQCFSQWEKVLQIGIVWLGKKITLRFWKPLSTKQLLSQRQIGPTDETDVFSGQQPLDECLLFDVPCGLFLPRKLTQV